MKCDELKPLVFSLNDLAYIDESAVKKNFENPHDHAVYKATEVDAAIAELKEAWRSEHEACEALKAELDKAIAERDGNQVCIDALKAKLEDAKATAYADSVDAGMRERRLRRALWLERARRAEARKNYWYARSCHEGDNFLVSIDGSAVKYIGCIKRTNYDWLLTWSEVEHKCRAKAEEYK